MDWSSVICAAITGVLAVVGQAIIAGRKTREDDIKDAQREQRQNDRLELIEKKVDEHNGYAQKFGEINVAIAEIRRDVGFLREKTEK